MNKKAASNRPVGQTQSSKPLGPRSSTKPVGSKSSVQENGARFAPKSGSSNTSVNANIASIYADIVQVIENNTNCDRNCAEKTCDEIIQLINSTIVCQINDNVAKESLTKMFYMKVDPEKNLLNSLSFALTSITCNNSNVAALCASNANNLDVDSLAEGDMALERNSTSNVFENAKSIEELVAIMNNQWKDILTHISNSVNQSSVLPLIDYLSLYITSSVESTNGECKNEISSTFSPNDSTLETIVGFILDIILCSDNASSHLVRNVSLFQIAFQNRLSDCKSWSILATFMLVQGGAQLANTVTKEQCSALLNDITKCEAAIDIVIPMVLSLNLGFIYPSQNSVLKCLVACSNHSVTDIFLTEIITLFNRNVDPLSQFYMNRKQTNESNSVLKLMIDIFSNRAAIKKIYTNDLKVIMDVILVSMSNLSHGSQERVDMLSLLDLAVKNAPLMSEQPRYKSIDFLALVQPISEQMDCLEEALIARSILSNMS